MLTPAVGRSPRPPWLWSCGAPAPHPPLLPQQLELDSKFRNHTCGLCGDYNGLQTYSEFLSDGAGLLGAGGGGGGGGRAGSGRLG